jgi:hypothetical protein
LRWLCRRLWRIPLVEGELMSSVAATVAGLTAWPLPVGKRQSAEELGGGGGGGPHGLAIAGRRSNVPTLVGQGKRAEELGV